MKTLLLAMLMSICCAFPAAAASLEEVTPYFSVQHYTWEEFNNGRRLLKESGELVAAGVLVGASTDSSVTLRAKAELFGGVVDYDGETQAPNPIPVQTDVNYFGVRNEFDLGYRAASGPLRIEPFAGLGYRWWLRDLEDSTAATGQPVSGYTEDWLTGYGRLGARGSYRPSDLVALFAEGGALYPFYTGNTVDFVGAGKVTFRPRGKVSGFAEAGAAWRYLRLSLYYEGFRWGKSPVKSVAGVGFLQPESTSDVLGVTLGWNFR
jgi:hypothetical protein